MQSLPPKLAAQIAASVGAEITQVDEWEGLAGDLDAIAYRFTVPNRRAKLRLLDALAWVDAKRDPRINELAMLIARRTDGTARGIARAIHRVVRDSVRFTREGPERFVDTYRTLLVTGVGDCDDTARAVVALARSVGLKAALVTVGRLPEGGHVVASIWDGKAWRYAETTLPGARFGEHPYAAKKRTKATNRADIAA